MALEYASTDAPLTNLGIKILVYGGAGIGKTVLTSTLPGETIIIGAEKGELSLSKANQMRIYGTNKTMPIIRIKDATTLRESYEMVISPHCAKFQNVSLDSVTDIAQAILENQLATQKDPRKAYGNMQIIMGKYLRLFRDIPNKNVYFTAQLERTQDEAGAILFAPGMPGKSLTEDLPYFFDEVFAMVVTGKEPNGKVIRKLRTLTDHQYTAKDRSGALLELEDPDLGNVIAKIKQN